MERLLRRRWPPLAAALCAGLVVIAACPGGPRAAEHGEPPTGAAEDARPAERDDARQVDDSGPVGPPSGAEGSGEADVWMVSTRRLPAICRLPEDVTFDVSRLAGRGDCRRWERSDLGELLAEPWRPLVIFVHGNRYNRRDAADHGTLLAHRLRQRRPTLGPPRLVVFSWPSERQGTPLKDVRRKYDRAYADGHYLAWLLGQLEPERPVALVCYSLGALVSAAAFEELATLAPAGVPWAQRPGRCQLVLVVPAIRCDSFAPTGPFRETLAGLDRFTLLINTDDFALRFFHLLEPGVKLPALGSTGQPRRWLPAELEYQATDVACVVGRLHTFHSYLQVAPLAERIAAGALDGLAPE